MAQSCRWLMTCSAAHSASLAGHSVGWFAMHVEHEATDRRRRIAAIVHEVGPIGVAQLGDVAAERFQQVERMPVRQATGPQDWPAALRLRGWRRSRRAARPPFARAARASPRRRSRHGRRHRPRHARSDRRPGSPARSCGRIRREATGKFSSRWPLPDAKSAAACHASPVMAWARPFHMPPRPRQTAKADCTVKACRRRRSPAAPGPRAATGDRSAAWAGTTAP